MNADSHASPPVDLDDEPAPDREAAPSKPKKRSGFLWRWTKRLFWFVVVAFVVVRLLLFFFLPTLLDWGVSSMGLTAKLEHHHLSLFGGSIELEHLDLAPIPADGTPADAPPPESLLHVEYLTADVDMSALLTGTIRVHRAELDGVDVLLERDSEGQLNWMHHFGGEPGEPEPKPAPEPEPESEPVDPTTELDLGLGIEVTAVRAQHVHVTFRDHLLAAPDAGSPRTTELLASVRVSDLGAPTRRTRLAVELHSPQGIDVLRIDGSGQSAGRNADLSLQITGSGLRLDAFRPYLADLGIRPHARELGLDTKVRLDVTPGPQPRVCAAKLSIFDVAITADGAEAVGLDSIDASVTAIGPEQAIVESVRIAGIRAGALQLADGGLRVAGFDLIPTAPATASPTAAPTPSTEPSSAPFNWSIEKTTLEGVALSWRDESTSPPVAVDVKLDGLELSHLDPAPKQPIQLDGTIEIPGVLESLAIQGSVHPTPSPHGEQLDLDLVLSGRQLTLAKVAPYLEAAGFTPTLQDGALDLQVTARVEPGETSTTVRAKLQQVELRDGATLLTLGTVDVPSMTLHDDGRVHIETVDLTGMRAPIARDEEQVLRMFGLRSLTAEELAKQSIAAAASAPTQAVTGQPQPKTAAAQAATSPAFTIGAIELKDWIIPWRDAGVEPTFSSDVTLGASIRSIRLGGDSKPDQPIALELTIGAAPAAEQIQLAGTVDFHADPLTLVAKLGATIAGLRPASLQPYFGDAEFATEIEAGSARLDLSADLRDVEGTLHGSIAVRDAAIRQGGDDVVRLAELAVDGLALGTERIRVDSVRIDGPTLAAERRRDGSLWAAGWQLAAAAGQPGETNPAATETAPPRAPTAAPQPEPQPKPQPASAPTAQSNPGPRLSIGKVELVGAGIRWRDASLDTPLEFATETKLRVEGIEFGGAPLAADHRTTFEIELEAGGVVDEFVLRGAAHLDPDNLLATAKLTGSGIRSGKLATYLPEGIECSLQDGRLGLELDAKVRKAEAGGQAIECSLRDLAYSDGAEEPFLALDEVRFAASRLDPAGNRFDVETVRLAGLRLRAERSDAQTLRALGFAIATPPPEAPGKATTPVAPQTDQPKAPAPRDQPRRDPRALLRKALTASVPPTIQIGEFSIELAGLTFVDRTVPTPTPLTLAMTLRTPGPTTLLGPKLEELEPIRLELRGGAAPIVREISLDTVVAPFVEDPTFAVDLAIEGLSGKGLLDALPALADSMSATDLRDGSLRSKLEGEVQMRRSDVTDFTAFSTGFGFEAHLDGIEYRATVDGPVIAGLEGADLEIRRIDPQTGDIHVKLFEVIRPIFHARNDKDGMHVLGLTFPPKTAEELAAEAAEAERAAAATTPAANPPTAKQTAEPQSEFRVDSLLVSGLDVRFVDATTESPTVIPLTELDVDVRGFTTKTFTENRPFSFRVNLNAGEVDLPERHYDSLLSGAFGAAGNLLSGQSDSAKTEKRALFDEVTVAGRLSFKPQLEGIVKLGVRDFELLGLRGLATGVGVEIGEGVLNHNAMVRFDPDGTTHVDSKLLTQYLSLDEPPDGPISKYLNLPAPLDTVLFVLRGEDSKHTVNLDLAVPSSGVSGGAIASLAAKEFLDIVTTAIAASPFRVAGGLTDVLGVTGGEPTALNERSVAVAYQPGAAGTPTAEEQAALRELVALTRDDETIRLVLQHDFGGGDRARAERLANPDPAACRGLAERLRHRRETIRATRSSAEVIASSHLRAGRMVAFRAASERLRDLLAEQGEVEKSLDTVLALLKPGAERRAPRRTHQALMRIANQRMAILADWLERQGVLAERIDARRPRRQQPDGDGGGKVSITPKIGG